MAYELKMTEVDHVGADDAADFVVKRYSTDSAGVQTFVDNPLSIDQDTGTILKGVGDYTQTCNPSTLTAAGSANLILPGVTQVDVGAVVNDANDWITLPAIASVPIGHTIRIACNAGGNFELRTPASSNTKINDVDADGSQEYLCTDTHLVIVTKRTTTGWVAQSLTKLGAVVTAVIPD